VLHFLVGAELLLESLDIRAQEQAHTLQDLFDAAQDLRFQGLVLRA
jgi:hypothetical protein